jgi:hypothetical protein
MRVTRWVVTAALFLGALVAALGSSDTSDPSPGPMCRIGCPCGRACIDCNDTCHMEDLGGSVDETIGKEGSTEAPR